MVCLLDGGTQHSSVPYIRACCRQMAICGLCMRCYHVLERTNETSYSVFVQRIVSQQYHTWYVIIIPENYTFLQDNACSLNFRGLKKCRALNPVP